MKKPGRLRKKLIELIKATSKYLDVIPIDTSDLVFEQRVLLNCFYCQRHNVNWTCPPHIPDLDYRKLICEYENALVVYCKMPLKKGKTAVLRRESTNILHRALLGAEKLLWENDYPLAVSFIGGSCKLCAEGCDRHGCRQPTLARIPVEAAGVNIVRTLAGKGLNIVFPPDNYLYRVGLLLW